MASQSSRSRHSSQSETALAQRLSPHVVCSICKRRYSIPKVLPCLHSFCQECLRRRVGRPAVAGIKIVIRCPKCDNKSDLPNSGVEGYCTNYPLGNIVEALEIHDAEEERAAASIFCENGLVECEGEAAVVYCTECCCYLCQNCKELHQRMRATRNHKMVTLNEVQKDFRKLERKHLCTEHQGEELKLYCRTCQEVICTDCTIVTHKQHDYTFIKDIREELVREMLELVSCAEEKGREFSRHQSHLDLVDKNSKKNIETCKDKVHKYFEEWRRRLNEREGQLLVQLDQHLEVASKQVVAERSTVDLSEGQITSAVEFTHSLLKDGAQYDIAMMSKQTCKQLKHVQTFHWNPDNVSPCNISFVDHKDTPTATDLLVNYRIRPDQIVVKRLGNPVPGVSKFTIEALKEIVGEAAMPIVRIETADGLEVCVKVDKGNSSKYYNCWTLSYEIPHGHQDTHYKISVSMNGVEAKGSPFERVWLRRLKQGMKVHRGQDWKYGNQDGGPGKTGLVINCLNSKALVRWEESGESYSYRWGENKCFDVEIAD